MSSTQGLSIKTKQINEQIGQRLRAIRLLNHVSQEQLGRVFGVSFQQVQKYENGVNRISAVRLVQAARFFNVPVILFFDGFIVDRAGEKADEATLRAAGYLNAIPDSRAQVALRRLIRAMAKGKG